MRGQAARAGCRAISCEALAQGDLIPDEFRALVLAFALALALVLVGVLAPWAVLKDALIAGTALARNSGDSRLVLAFSIDGSVCTCLCEVKCRI